MKKKSLTAIKSFVCAVAVTTNLIYGGAFSTVSAETVSTTVTAQVDGEYTVTIPKEIVLTLQDDGSHAGSYTVDVNGTIPKNAYVTVVPDNEVTLSSNGRTDVQCDVTQAIRTFRATSYDGDLSGSTDTVKIDNDAVEANGTVKTKDGQTLVSGTWNGTLNFNISLNYDGTVSSGDAGDTCAHTNVSYSHAKVENEGVISYTCTKHCDDCSTDVETVACEITDGHCSICSGEVNVDNL